MLMFQLKAYYKLFIEWTIILQHVQTQTPNNNIGQIRIAETK